MMKQIFSTHWAKIPVQEKVSIKDYLLNFLAQKGLSCDDAVRNMIIIVLAKIAKMSWFDHPELQSVVQDLMQLFPLSQGHMLIGLKAIHDLIIEMTYVHKVKNLTINRRISLNFRDNALFQIFKQVLALTQ